jgi:hypothetical protein
MLFFTFLVILYIKNLLLALFANFEAKHSKKLLKIKKQMKKYVFGENGSLVAKFFL